MPGRLARDERCGAWFEFKLSQTTQRGGPVLGRLARDERCGAWLEFKPSQTTRRGGPVLGRLEGVPDDKMLALLTERFTGQVEHG